MRKHSEQLFAALLAGKEVRYLNAGGRIRSIQIDGEGLDGGLVMLAETDREWLALEKIAEGRYEVRLTDAGLAHLIDTRFIEVSTELIASTTGVMVSVVLRNTPVMRAHMANHWISRINMMLRDGRLKMYPESGTYVLRGN